MSNSFLYVSPSLLTTEFPRNPAFGRDLVFNGVLYRRLDVHYYLWLKHQIEKLAELSNKKKVKFEEFSEMYHRWLLVEEWVQANVPADKIKAGQKGFTPKKYKKPENPGNPSPKELYV